MYEHISHKLLALNILSLSVHTIIDLCSTAHVFACVYYILKDKLELTGVSLEQLHSQMGWRSMVVKLYGGPNNCTLYQTQRNAL